MTEQNQKPENLLGEKIFDSNPLCYICSGKPELSPGTIFVAGYCQKCQGNGLFAVNRGTWGNTLKVGQLDGKLFVEATKNQNQEPKINFTPLRVSDGGYPETSPAGQDQDPKNPLAIHLKDPLDATERRFNECATMWDFFAAHALSSFDSHQF